MADSGDSLNTKKAKTNTFVAQPHYHDQPYRTIAAAFAAWKVFLFAIALGCGLLGVDAYDTSAGVLIDPEGKSGGLISRFVSWDAIYFVSSAKRGYVFEQEWAFGAGLPVVLRGVLRGLRQLNIIAEPEGQGAFPEALVGIIVANTAHLLSAFVLFRLGRVVWRDRTLALVAALLHVLSPGGLFLSSPYAESSYALLAFSGYLLFALSCASESRPLYRDLYLIGAGVLFGLATLFRSNGILNGIPFAWEVLRHLPDLSRQPRNTVRRLIALGVGGLCVAAGSVIPQTIAYLRLCSPGASGQEPPRPWCQRLLPSIYTFNQEHYWNVGFLRYWTPGNIPLFVLATPMLAILVKSGVDQLTAAPSRRPENAAKSVESDGLLSLVRSAAAAQVVLAVLAITNYHVQIITRISSGLPLWYWWLAGSLVKGDKMGSHIVKYMVIYAAIQGALFASFLPPA